jgi:hypothetical protein
MENSMEFHGFSWNSMEKNVMKKNPSDADGKFHGTEVDGI